MDGWFVELLAAAAGDLTGATGRVAVAAVGGYGRRELSPGSDVDVVLLHTGGDVAELANRLWYPLWDAGLKLGHGVRTPKEALALAATDLDTATALLDARPVAGDASLVRDLTAAAATQWEQRAVRNLETLRERVEERHARTGEVAFLLEPDLKEGKGGLRDVHALRWAERAGAPVEDADGVGSAYEVLLDVRVELHRVTGRASDQLVLQEQDAVAAAIGYGDADELMAGVAGAARSIAWWSDSQWRRITRGRPKRGLLSRRERERAVGDLVLRDGEVLLTDNADLSDLSLPLRAADAAAAEGSVLSASTLTTLAAASLPTDEVWPATAREALVRLLGRGHDAIAPMEALDQHGILVRLVPEWQAVRNKPQRNAYHRFTVDRHLCEAAANAARLVGSVSRPDLLLVGALLHDIGKGYPGDHTEVGIEVVGAIGRRMGYADADVELLVAMVRHHLLLPDVATRRDLDDPVTTSAVAEAVGDVTTLELLAALTEADSLATGPSAWSSWKAGLVADLVNRTRRVLQGHEVTEASAVPTPDQRALMAGGRLAVVHEDSTLTVVAPDRPGLFARVAGTLSLHGLDILGATAGSSEDGMAVEVFQVESAFDVEPDWARIEHDLGRALAGRLALGSRLDERMRTYRPRRPLGPEPAAPRVVWHHDASESATVLEVRAPDAAGVLYRITRALADCELDVRSAKVQTLGQEVVDTFYVRDSSGSKIEDPDYLREIERAILGALRR